MIQLASVVRFRVTPICFQSCSCLYKGMEFAYFWYIVHATADADAQLWGISASGTWALTNETALSMAGAWLHTGHFAVSRQMLTASPFAGVNRNSRRTNSLPITSISAPQSVQRFCSSESGMTSSFTGTPLKSSAYVPFALRVCSLTTVSSASCSASSKRLICPSTFFDFSLDVPKSFFVR